MRRIQAIMLTSVALVLSLVVFGLPGAATAASGSSAPIVVGGVATVAAFAGSNYGFEAGIRQFNASGGLDGRKIKFVGVLDDGGDPSTSYTDAQKLVQVDHVFAVAPFISPVAAADFGTYLAQNKVPFLGYSISPAFVVAPTWGYSVDGMQINPQYQSTNAAVLMAKGLGLPPSQVKVAYIGTDVPGQVTGLNTLADGSRAIGEKVVYAQALIPPVGVTSYAPYAQDVIASGANVVYGALAEPSIVGLDAALKAAGWSGQSVSAETYLPGVLATQPNLKSALDGSLVETGFPVNQDNTPAVRQEEKELKAIGQPTGLLIGDSLGYWSAQVLIQMLQATEKSVGSAAKVTPAALQKTVNAGFTYKDTLAGGLGTLKFPISETEPNGCGGLEKTVGDGYKFLAPYECPGTDGIYLYKVSSSGVAKKIKNPN